MSSENRYCKLEQSATIRARVALVLAIAQRVIPALTANAEAFKAAHRALIDAWQWEEGGAIPALQLYESDVDALAVQGSLVVGEEASAAMFAATSAFYYVLWQAFRQDLKTGRVREGDIPNDIAEITEDVIDEVCRFAAETSLCDSLWINSAMERVCADFPAGNANELGPVVHRQYFDDLTP